MPSCSSATWFAYTEAMRSAARELASFEALHAQIRALPEGQTGQILDAGALTVLPRPHPRHQRAMQGVLRAVRPRNVDDGGTGWWILTEVEVRFADDRLLVPDLVGWRVERVPDMPDENPIRVVPDWACEIVSPGSARIDRLKKLRIYAQHRVPWVWIVDPEARSVECFETVGGLPRQSVVAEEGDEAALPPFDLPIDVGAIWVGVAGE